MKKINVIFLIGCMLLFSLCSCKKFLDEKPLNNIATPSTIGDLQALLDNSSKLNTKVTPCKTDGSADDYFLLDASFSSIGTKYQNIYLWTPYQYLYGPNDWSACYTPIYISNLCIEQLNNVPKTIQNTNDWNNVQGSAFFYRAYYFLQLTWEFSKAYDENTASADLGIPLRTASDFTIPSVRASVKDSYDKIISDAKEASIYLPDVTQHVTRPSKASAYGLLARTYLSMRQYDSSLKYSNLCLAIKSDLLDYNQNVVSPTASVAFTQLYQHPEIIFYTEMNNTIVVQTPSSALVDSLLFLSYDANDLRKSEFFKVSGNYHKFRGSYAASSNTFFTGITTDEMFLIRAESYGRTGNKDAALADLNTLLINRWQTGQFVPITAVDATDAVEKILVERRKELIFRGIRWSDIKRLNKEGRNIILTRKIAGQTYSLQPNANYYALPIPDDIISSGIPQNPL